MKRDEPENLDLLAAEYVLGTLVGGARRSFERRRSRDPFVDRRVRAWEERFAVLAWHLEPVTPSHEVWVAIERRTRARTPTWWRALAAAIAAVAVLGLGWVLWQELRPPQATAVLATQTGSALWRLELAADGNHVVIEAVGEVRHSVGRSLELWALPADAAPVSLGLMPAAGRARVTLDERQRMALAESANVAVSDEPKGGSPTGAPTGPVLYVAPIERT